MSAAFIMIELEIKFPEHPKLTPGEAQVFITHMRKIASAGAVAALGTVLSESSTVTAEASVLQ
jgi:hypothetical protein